MTPKIFQAAEWATVMHDGQRRKYDGTPYITHVFRVAARVAVLPETAFHGNKEDAVVAALLHDVVEDCCKDGLTADDLRNTIARKFGTPVAILVDALTDQPKEWGNRKARKEDTKTRLVNASRDARTIKCADLLDNAADIVCNDKNFGPRFLEEKAELLPYLDGAYRPILDECYAELSRLKQYVRKVKTSA